MRNRWLVGPALAATAIALAACSSPAASTPPAAASSPAPARSAVQAGANPAVIRTMSTSKGTVLTDGQGRTLYWFARDTAAQSNCYGSCAAAWPPVTGTNADASSASLPHGFGTIRRTNGQSQLTYDGHPLYTYAGDTAAGQLNGNDIKASGGRWWAVTPAGTKIRSKAAPSPASSSSAATSSGW
jgi:predicted lipoprotein with Yx(FWY)xxD motif